MRLIDADAALETFQELTELAVGEGAALVKALIFAGLKSRSVTPTVSGWISAKDRLPENTNHVLALCEVRPYKRLYKCIAMYVRPHELSEGKYPEDDTYFDYDEDEDEYYLKPGWYEIGQNFDEFGAAVIEDFVTHWMPLPEPPEVSE